ncbi:MAG: DUF1254 domain-containing protein [Thermomicrobiales bacterium]
MANTLRHQRNLSRRRLLQASAAGAGLLAAQASGLSLLPAPASAAQTPDAAEAAIEAWMYGYALLNMGISADVLTNVAAPNGDKAPYNQMSNKREFPDASFTAVVAPNVDTLYTSAFLDLSQGPLVFEWPDMATRYYLFPFLNGWTDVVSFGSRTDGQHAGTLVIAGPDWDGEVPAGITLPDSTIGLRVSTNLTWLIGRIYCDGSKEDLDAVHAIQDQLKLTPLAEYGKAYTPPAGTVNPDIANTAPVDQVNEMDAETYFAELAKLLPANSPYPADAPTLSRMADLGIVAGQPFDFASLAPEIQTALKAAPAAGLASLKKDGPGTVKNVDGWLYSVGLGDYGTDYLLRSYVALIGLGANLSEDAIYPAAFTDSAGDPLDGKNKYVIHFDTLPPVKGFWSLTAYNDKSLLIANPLNRYALRGNDKLAMSPGGALDVYLQAENPGPEREANWLPTGDSAFSVYLRLYWPEQAALDGAWKLPVITKVG